jgi:hypothetical protein
MHLQANHARCRLLETFLLQDGHGSVVKSNEFSCPSLPLMCVRAFLQRTRSAKRECPDVTLVLVNLPLANTMALIARLPTYCGQPFEHFPRVRVVRECGICSDSQKLVSKGSSD